MRGHGRCAIALALVILGMPGWVGAEDWWAAARTAVAERWSAATANAPASPSTVPAVGSIQVAFSPSGGATGAIVAALGEARQRLWVQAYSFTSAPIAKAVLAAAKRGVQVTVLLDKSQRTQQYSEADFFANQGVPVYIDDQHAIAHNKVMIIDGGTVVTGSFNFSRAAEQSNAENLLILRGNPPLTALYAQNFRFHLGHATPYRPRHGRD